MAKKVAIISTSCDKLGETGQHTGSWAEEVAAPFYVFQAAGFKVVIASVKGGEIPWTKSSLEEPAATAEVKKFFADDSTAKLVKETVPLSSLKAEDYDAFFLAGGHGTCYDFSSNKELGALLSATFQTGKIVSAVCHGPTGLVTTVDKDGVSIVKGRKVTGFSNAEETAVGLDKVLPFLLEDKLKDLGGLYSKAEQAWAPYAVQDGNLITGQNPASSAKTAELVVAALKA